MFESNSYVNDFENCWQGVTTSIKIAEHKFVLTDKGFHCDNNTDKVMAHYLYPRDRQYKIPKCC